MSDVLINTIDCNGINGIQKYVYSTLYVHGWAVVESGVERYMYSVDGGKTWTEIGRIVDGANMSSSANDAMIKSANNHLFTDDGFNFSATDAGNGSFQSASLLRIDLKEYADKTVNLILAAIPNDDPNGLCILTEIQNINVKDKYSLEYDVGEYVNEAGGSKYILSDNDYICHLDWIERASYTVTGKSSSGISRINFNTVVNRALGKSNNEEVIYDNDVTDDIKTKYTNYSTNGTDSIDFIGGWAVVDSGISKYVWTYDGITWYDVDGNPTAASDSVITSANNSFADSINSYDKANGGFQNPNTSLSIDFSKLFYDENGNVVNQYLLGKTISI